MLYVNLQDTASYFHILYKSFYVLWDPANIKQHRFTCSMNIIRDIQTLLVQ